MPIDAVGGTSIGSVAAFMYVMDWDHGERMARLPRFFSTRLIIQPTLPLVSLSSGGRVVAIDLHRQVELKMQARFPTFDFATAPQLVDEAHSYAQEQLTEATVVRLLDPDPFMTTLE